MNALVINPRVTEAHLHLRSTVQTTTATLLEMPTGGLGTRKWAPIDRPVAAFRTNILLFPQCYGFPNLYRY